jgi:hypothetical protein
MKSRSRLIAALVVVSLLGGGGVLAHAIVFGVVTQAHRATLSSGTEIRADRAFVRAAAEVPTFGQITIINAAAFEIYAWRGALKIQYRDEAEAIAEGTSYRVVLDASNDDDSSAKSTAGEKPRPVKATPHKRKRMGLISIGSSAAGAASAIPLAVLNDYESPDHP